LLFQVVFGQSKKGCIKRRQPNPEMPQARKPPSRDPRA
jgi:hypothetical protein